MKNILIPKHPPSWSLLRMNRVDEWFTAKACEKCFPFLSFFFFRARQPVKESSDEREQEKARKDKKKKKKKKKIKKEKKKRQKKKKKKKKRKKTPPRPVVSIPQDIQSPNPKNQNSKKKPSLFFFWRQKTTPKLCMIENAALQQKGKEHKKSNPTPKYRCIVTEPDLKTPRDNIVACQKTPQLGSV